MWKLKSSPKTTRVTHKLATEFMEMDPTPHDRPLSERRLQVYQRLFAKGEFRPCTWAKAYCSETDGVYRVNGKHTSTLLAGLEHLPEFYVTIEDYLCDTLEDVAQLYATFDSKMMSRTNSDINFSFAGTIKELEGVGSRIINLAVAGMSYAIWQNDLWGKQPAERAELLLDHPGFVLWLNDITVKGTRGGKSENNTTRHLCRQGVVAAMFGNWQKAKTASTEFWKAVRDEDGTRPTLPDRRLAKFLTTSTVRSSRGGAQVKTTNTREVYVKCIHAWNAWRRGETTDLKYYKEARVPAIS